MSSVHTSPDITPSQELAVVYRPISELKADPKNPRTHSRKQVDQIAKSIKTFNFNAPILIDAESRIIAGHGRLLACQKLGWTSVPTITLRHLTPAQAKAYLIADNRLTENSEWNDRLLGEIFQELSVLDLDFSLDVTGFELPEIDLKIDALSSDEEEEDEADQVPETSGPAVSKPGDIWQLGSHRIICGSALEETTFERLLGNEKAALVFTDPPYNVPVEGHVSGNGDVRHREFAMASGEMSEAEFAAFLRQACALLAAHSAPGSIHYICMDWRHVVELSAAGKAAYEALLNICVWVKHNGGLGSLYRSQHELVFVFKTAGGATINNVQLGKFGRNRTNVWTYRGMNSFRKDGEGDLLAMHPTVKPVALVADAILDCSRRGDYVLDSFLGSGSTLIACERTGRVCRGIELDPLYIDTAIRRWQRFSGRKAMNLTNGTTFNAIEETCSNE